MTSPNEYSPKPLPWRTVQREIESAVREGFPNQRFVSGKKLARYMHEHHYPYYSETTIRSSSCRVTMALKKDVLKSGWRLWSSELSGGKQKVFVVPWVEV